MVTVEAIYEATLQVLLAMGGPNRLTTTRVAKRAGVSVGTLYQYFPNKQSLLLLVLKKHHDRVASAVELACRRNHGQQLSTMIESVVEAFVDAKMERADMSMALYDGRRNTSGPRSWVHTKDGTVVAKAVGLALPGLPNECSYPSLRDRREVTLETRSDFTADRVVSNFRV